MRSVSCSRELDVVLVATHYWYADPKMCLVLYVFQKAKDLVSAEIGILKAIQHPHIIHMEDYFEDADSISIVMELLPDGDLYTQVAARG